MKEVKINKRRLFTWLAILTLWFISYFSICIMGTQKVVPISVPILSIKTVFSTLIGNLKTVGLAESLIAATTLYLITREVWQKNVNVEALLLSLVYSVFLLIGFSFKHLGNFGFFFSSVNQFLVAGICFLGISCTLYGIVKICLRVLDQYRIRVQSKDIMSKIDATVCFFSMLVLWIVFEVVFFPGSVPHDGRRQLIMYEGYRIMSTHDSYAGTLLVGFLYSIGKTLFTDKYATLFFVLLQNIVNAAVFTSITSYIGSTDKRIGFFTWLFYSIVPIWWIFNQTVIKDTLFFGMFAYFILQVIVVYQEQESKIDWLHLVKLSISGLLTCVLRNNGMYVILPFIVILWLQSQNRKQFVIAGVFLITTALFFQVILPKIDRVQKASVWEMYSIPCQQIARSVVEHEEEMTCEEKAMIDVFFPLEECKNAYKPGISDNIKNKAKISNPNADEMKQFWALWRSLFRQYPRTYIVASFNHVWGYLDPFYITKDQLQYNFYNKQALGEKDRAVTYSQYVFSEDIQNIVKQYAYMWNKIPLLQLFVMPGFYLWLTVFFVIDLLFQNRKRDILLLVAPILCILICFVSPINGYLRYMLPVCAVIPLYFILVLNSVCYKQ